jgi:transposase
MFSEFFDPVENLKIEIEDLKVQVTRNQDKITFLSDENTWLREQLSELKRNQFGRKSERWESPEQTLLFNEAEVESLKPPGPDSTEKEDAEAASAATESEVKGHKRKRGHRQPLPEGLDREVVKIELPVEEQISDDGTPLKVIGWEISEKLKYEPAKTSVVEYHRAKYGADSGDYEKTAPPIPSIIPKGIATSELLSAIAVSKYADGLPLYRMEEIFKRHGIDLTRGTMARWLIKVAEACLPVWNVLSDRWHDSFYVAVDETKLQVLKEKGRKAESDSWMFVRSAPFGPEKIVLFDYSPSRAGAVAQKLFADYKGYFQCDELSSYDCLESADMVRVGCNMHGRRGFDKATVSGAKEGKSLGEMGLAIYKRIYDVEDLCEGKSFIERHQIRQELARPIWDEFKDWIDKQKNRVPKKSKIGNAINYIDRHFEHLTAYLKDGRLNLDNGFTERAIRKFAIGRNNWMFSDSEAGANASAVLYSFVVTAKMNGANPYKALVKLFNEIPKATSVEDFERLADLILKPEGAS